MASLANPSSSTIEITKGFSNSYLPGLFVILAM
jgi:hypothetical protein